MKNVTLSIFSLLLFAFAAQAQAPQAFKYQAVVRDAAGQALANQSVGLKIELSATAGILYTETHTATTNAFGLVNLEIGRGQNPVGDFAQMDWSQQPISVQISLDASGGTNYQLMGSSELLSVPYALYAANGSALPANASTGDLLYYDGSAWQKLPAAPCAVLSTGADGLPYWQTPPPGLQTYYADADGDGFGNAALSQLACSTPVGYVLDNTDCDDAEASVYPGAEEVCGDGIDQDCDGEDCCPEIPDLLLVTLPDGSCLYVHPTDNSISIPWGGNGTDIPGLANSTNSAQANADFAGEANTAAIVAQLGAGTYAAKLCADLVAYGYDDWYLPAAGELNTMYQQLGLYLPAAGELNTMYQQLELANNGFGGSDQIPTYYYWSSSEFNDNDAWFQDFEPGFQVPYVKNLVNRCRCVRR